MRRAAALLALLFALSACTSTTSNSLAITNVTVIDATGAPPRSGVTVVVENGRIAAVGEAVRAPRGARVIDGRGKYLIPGLVDMHTHLSFWGEEALPELVRYGVLSVRDLGGLLEELDRWRDEIVRGTRVGPRIYRAGPYLDGPKEMQGLRAKTTIVVTTAEEGRKAVASLHALGVDTIKTHNTLPRDAYLAIADECRRLDLPLATHLASRTV